MNQLVQKLSGFATSTVQHQSTATVRLFWKCCTDTLLQSLYKVQYHTNNKGKQKQQQQLTLFPEKPTNSNNLSIFCGSCEIIWKTKWNRIKILSSNTILGNIQYTQREIILVTFFCTLYFLLNPNMSSASPNPQNNPLCLTKLNAPTPIRTPDSKCILSGSLLQSRPSSMCQHSLWWQKLYYSQFPSKHSVSSWSLLVIY